MKITLPIPSKMLSPNARTHRWDRARVTKAHRQRSKVLTLQAIGLDPTPTFSGYTLAFFWPDKRRRDDDNAQASCKAYRDGIADALGVDDHTLKLAALPTFEIDRANPRVEITLTAQEGGRS